MPTYKTPGVYVQEIPILPPSVAEVQTAIPAFIGYTATTRRAEKDLARVPTAVASLVEFESLFGGRSFASVTALTLDPAGNVASATRAFGFHLHESLRLYFANGGGSCSVCSVGTYRDDGLTLLADLQAGLDAVRAIDDVTLLVVPDAVALSALDLYALHRAALRQCGELRDRFAILDVHERSGWRAGIDEFRTQIGREHLSFGAVYTPWLRSSLTQPVVYRELNAHLGAIATTADETIRSIRAELERAIQQNDANREAEQEQELLAHWPAYARVVNGISGLPRSVPPCGAVAGVYFSVDRNRGVWKAPASVALASVTAVTTTIADRELEGLNVDPVSGISINAIRAFAGRGIMIWGARTLVGNDNEWRYVSVRRFVMMVEESVKKSTAFAVFEPNNETLWVKVRAMIENYLVQKWREGALLGSRTSEAFFVHAGAGSTMTQRDVLAGKLIIEIGLAMVRPSEFLIVRVEQHMQPAP